MGTHWHEFYEMDIVLSGTGEVIHNGNRLALKRGLVSFLSPTDYHQYNNCNNVKLISVKFAETEIDTSVLNVFLSSKNTVVYADDKSLQVMETLCDLLGSIDSAEFNMNVIKCLVLTFMKNCTAKFTMDYDSETIQKAVMYINTHFRSNPKMSDVAQLFYLSETYFCRLFKNYVGTSYKQYIKKLKLEHAYKLIKFSDLAITDICLNCGYETQSHFNREFKKFFNTSPSNIRKSFNPQSK